MPHIQFSLKWMLIALTIACVLLFLLVTVSNFVPIALSFVVWCVVPTPIVIFAIYARGDHQAFAIGALVPWVMLTFFRAPAGFAFFAAYFFWLLPVGALCGILAAATRRWIINSQSRD